MGCGKNDGKRYKRDTCQYRPAEQKYSGRKYRKGQRFQFAVSFPTDYPKNNIGKAEGAVHG